MTEHYEWKTELTEDGARAWKEKLVNKNKVLRIVEKLPVRMTDWSMVAVAHVNAAAP